MLSICVSASCQITMVAWVAQELLLIIYRREMDAGDCVAGARVFVKAVLSTMCCCSQFYSISSTCVVFTVVLEIFIQSFLFLEK